MAVNWYVVVPIAVVAGMVTGLAVIALRTPEGHELAIASGLRLVKLLLGWLEAWMVAKMVVSARSVGGAAFMDGRLARVRELRRLVNDL